jgi:UDP-N-acetylmuramoyl-L-alanyl-D-glutamate--2,6-diaminopimelate ligase
MQIRDIHSVVPQLSLSDFNPNAKISFISRDSSNLDSDCVFVAIKGNSWDGHSFIDQAIAKNVQLILAESYHGKNKKVVIVPNSRKTFADLCHMYQGKPSEKLFTVGITGTNGKTTTSFMVETILNKLNMPCGVIGTINHHLQDKVWPTKLTSPGAEELQLRLKQFVEAGAKSAVMEVTSHALDQHRVDGTQFDAAIFTNLTQDHLDYHKTMDNYYLAKERLFTDLLAHSSKKNPVAFVNADDIYARRVSFPNMYSYGRMNGDIRFSVLKMDFNGTNMQIVESGKHFKAHISTVGLHNIYNAFSAALTTKALGMGLEETLKLLADAPSVAGRLEKMADTKGRHIFVDYAHTPDALERALLFLKEIQLQQNDSKQKLIVVFGAGGNRDKTKRPIMGEIATRLADHVIVTSDNPRFEKPDEIIRDILVGCKKAQNLKSIVDRREAIRTALTMSQDNDIVIIAGKGHEDYQEIEGVRHPFSDQKCVKEFFR